jgi:hypothetical protein
MAERVMNHGEKHHRSRTAALGYRVRHGGPRAIATADACLRLHTCDPLRTIDTNVRGSNPKRPMH